MAKDKIAAGRWCHPRPARSTSIITRTAKPRRSSAPSTFRLRWRASKLSSRRNLLYQFTSTRWENIKGIIIRKIWKTIFKYRKNVAVYLNFLFYKFDMLCTSGRYCAINLHRNSNLDTRFFTPSLYCRGGFISKVAIYSDFFYNNFLCFKANNQILGCLVTHFRHQGLSITLCN